jgi:ribosomal protein L11 methyltransferase
MPSCVIAAPASEVAELHRLLTSAGAHTVDVHALGSVRSVSIGWFADAMAAADLTRSFRSDGRHATFGPSAPDAMLAWQAHTEPVTFAAGCCVCFPWSFFDRDGWTEVVEIDPGGFGAGRHPSTRLILGTLGGAGRHLAGKRVLDVGCGSGVLAVAAARRGAHVTAVDISQRAIEATGANARHNGVADQIDVSDSPIEAIDGSFDLVLANIHAPVLMDMARDFRRLRAPGATLTISGFSIGQESVVTAAMAPVVTVQRLEMDGWVAQVMA